MGRVISSGDTKVIDKKGNTRFFSDTLINNAQFMKDGGWEIFDSPDVPEAPTFNMDDEAALKAKADAEAKAKSDAEAEELRLKNESEAKKSGSTIPEKNLADADAKAKKSK